MPPPDAPFPDHTDQPLGFLSETPAVVVLRPPRRPYALHALLFLLTVVTTMIVGARLEDNFLAGRPMFLSDEDFFPWRQALADPGWLWRGAPFSLALLGSLLAHEMGHFLLALRHRVYATLPYFLPSPSPFGTFGAFIKIKSAFRSRQALLEIGIAGPIAGFAVALPCALVGLMLSEPLPAGSPAQMEIHYPLIFHLCFALLKIFGWHSAATAPLSQLLLHPLAVAAWIGMLATSLNLIPGGQLDGGHILYALGPRWHRPVTRWAIVLLVPMAIFYWTGWLIWVFGLMLTLRHPPVPAAPTKHPGAWAIGALLLFALTFLPAPFTGNSIYELIYELIQSHG